MIRGQLSFATLRRANTIRLPLFKNALGAPAHSQPDGSDWSYGEWMNAILGELGEAANIVKKVRRGDFTLDEARPKLADELADIITYLDITAFQLKITLDCINFFDFDSLQNHARHYHPHRKSLGELMTQAFGEFGYAARLIDHAPDRARESPTITDLFIAGLFTMGQLSVLANIDLTGAVAGKFNTVSARVGADVFINVGDQVVNDAGAAL